MNQEPLNDCGCCEGVEPATPVAIANRSGLSALVYRCGTHATFKQSMQAALSSSRFPTLAKLGTRDDDDFSIALLDAWATTADVLTFYQERIAQESYLRTATERVSLLQLGRLIGYELRPGVAASTFLAFTTETAPGAPAATPIDVGSKVQSVPGPGEKPQVFETIEKIEARPEWNALRPRLTLPGIIDASTTRLYLDGLAANLKKGDTLLLLGAEVATGTRAWDLCRIRAVELENEAKRTRVELSDSPTHFSKAGTDTVRVFAMRQRASLFGFNAPDRRMIPDATLAKFDAPSSFSSLVGPISGGLSGFVGIGGVEAMLLSDDWKFVLSGNTVPLDAVYPAITVGSWLTLTSPTRRALCRVLTTEEAGQHDYTLTGKTTQLTVEIVASPSAPTVSMFGGGSLRSTTVLGDSQELAFAETPVPPTISGAEVVIVSDRLDELRAGRWLAVTGTRASGGAAFAGLVQVVSSHREGKLTTLTVAPPLPELDVESVRINANVARATHGETVSEILGSGDASVPFQQFTLRQPPLTYVRAAGPSGARSTLELRVNDLLWHEVPSLYGHGPDERIYVTRMSDEGVTTVQFGDGVTGARLPTGAENVRATYRRGIGTEALVKPDQLSVPLTRPLGMKGVTNPVAADGAADREQLADARRNAPLTVLTLDRIVSLQNYEDFVRAFAGIAKASATWTWDGERRGVFVTVAGPAGAEVDLSGDFGGTLLAAIDGACVPGVPVRLQSYRKSAGLFTVAGRVKIDPEHGSERVLAAVRSVLQSEFSFEGRSFGEPVHLSQVISAMQSVDGVVAVDVDEFHRLEPPAAAVVSTAPATLATAIIRSLAATRARVGFLGSPALRRFTFRGVELASLIPLRRLGRLTPVVDRIVAAAPRPGATGEVSPAELLVLAPLEPKQIGAMP